MNMIGMAVLGLGWIIGIVGVGQYIRHICRKRGYPMAPCQDRWHGGIFDGDRVSVEVNHEPTP